MWASHIFHAALAARQDAEGSTVCARNTFAYLRCMHSSFPSLASTRWRVYAFSPERKQWGRKPTRIQRIAFFFFQKGRTEKKKHTQKKPLDTENRTGARCEDAADETANTTSCSILQSPYHHHLPFRKQYPHPSKTCASHRCLFNLSEKKKRKWNYSFKDPVHVETALAIRCWQPACGELMLHSISKSQKPVNRPNRPPAKIVVVVVTLFFCFATVSFATKAKAHTLEKFESWQSVHTHRRLVQRVQRPPIVLVVRFRISTSKEAR